jgi:hypothetical protein
VNRAVKPGPPLRSLRTKLRGGRMDASLSSVIMSNEDKCPSFQVFFAPPQKGGTFQDHTFTAGPLSPPPLRRFIATMCAPIRLPLPFPPRQASQVPRVPFFCARSRHETTGSSLNAQYAPSSVPRRLHGVRSFNMSGTFDSDGVDRFALTHR